MSEILSKGEFRDLPLLRGKRSSDPLDINSRQLYAVINAYDAVINEMVRLRDENNDMRRDISAVVNSFPVDSKLPKLRLILIGFMVPWFSRLFKNLVTLCNYVE